MQVLIDNLDGSGSVDYAGCLQFGKQATITRDLNKASVCKLPLALEVAGLVQPVLHARVQVITEAGLTLFTGYVATEPRISVTGQSGQGLTFTTSVVCVSDELLLDQTVPTSQALLNGLSAEQDWASLAELSTGSQLQIALPAQLSSSSRLEVAAGSRWSESAAALASATGSAYRSIAGAVQVSTVGEVMYSIADDDPGLQFGSIVESDLRWVASDVTICGREEATAYVTEIFQGDGVTASFGLSERPFSPTSKQKTAIADSFQGTSLNARVWTTIDPGGHLSLTASGLTCSGGTGRDAETIVQTIQQIELGGSLTLEATGVQVGGGSTGTILGLYDGGVVLANCFAGFAVSPAAGGISIAATINGASPGASFNLIAGRIYTLRLRISSPEMERTRQSYFYREGTSWNAFGGELIPSEGLIEFELQDVTSGTPSAPVVVYAGVVNSMPASCMLGLLDSGSLQCSIKSVQCSQSTPLMVAVGQPGTVALSQFVGAAVDGGACRVTSTGTLEFYPSNVPAAGSLVYASYRARGRAVARRAAASSPAAGRIPPTSMRIGTVSSPVAWSSVDCDNAAAALLQIASSNLAALKGTYKCSTLQKQADIWPGDLIQLAPNAGEPTLNGIVRESQLTLAASMPEAVEYTARFANDTAESLSLKLSSTIPADAVLPEQPTTIGSALLNLSSMSVTSVTATQIVLSTGVSAPASGGFEVRRRDNTFGPGTDSDLVLRTAAESMVIPRAAPVEQYYVRMYDGAIPPNYSLFSAAVFTNLPT